MSTLDAMVKAYGGMGSFRFLEQNVAAAHAVAGTRGDRSAYRQWCRENGVIKWPT